MAEGIQKTKAERFDKGKDYYANTGEDLRKLIPKESKRILDVGCGRGLIGKTLKDEGAAEVAGIELDKEAAEEARANLDWVYVGDVEDAGLPFKDGYFDCLIFGDILEHLVDPWSAIKAMKRFLRDGGYVASSVPNIGHWSIIRGLLSGSWDYKESGILDISHLRFFTMRSLRKFFEDEGLMIEKITPRLSCSKFFKKIDKILDGRITHLLTWQYLVLAKKIG